MPELVLLSPQNRFVKDILKLKIQPKPWMHLGIIKWDNGKRGYVLWIWDSRQVIEEGYLSEEQKDRIDLYITDHFLSNEIKTNDNFLPLSGGGNISKAISEYFDRHYDNLVSCIEAYLNLSYEEAIHELSELVIILQKYRIISCSVSHLLNRIYYRQTSLCSSSASNSFVGSSILKQR